MSSNQQLIKRKYRDEWKAKKLAEDPDYFRRYTREQYAKNPRKILDMARKRRKLHPEKAREYRQKTLIKHPETTRASYMKHRHRSDLSTRSKVIACRYVPLKKTCEKCNLPLKIERHHNDYLKPLEVNMFCKECHEEWHIHNKALHQYDNPHLLDNRHCQSCSKHFPKCSKYRPSYNGRTCALWNPLDGNWIVKSNGDNKK